MPHHPPAAFSRLRTLLCSRENADRIATRVCEETRSPVSVLRTDFPLQPFRVIASRDVEPVLSGMVEHELMIL
ncbi:hypothetical protein HNO88_002489 [Novosphingobium chloroacetimidivorans]|uniref:Uncharacterized protein n=1 Tax=Novosphingobium chloroacetimidivorans TaxID=1428314 RepID=A0A7W7NXG2_9SPHN|nr:hypothetical protein [Novosphingobium chloroacetimidivorans]MBB4859160.1 hypothetical protein [Novosphingobium chloroacetimidivorans]